MEIRIRILKECYFKNWLGNIIGCGNGKFKVLVTPTGKQIEEINGEIHIWLTPEEVEPC